MNVIVFSKDRPLQLHAYIESLLHYSELSQNQIIIIYKESEKIPYEKVKRIFDGCKWINETNFDLDLRMAIELCSSHIMFGCDDVLFIGDLKLKECITYLDDRQEIFGVSLRLGDNINPHPVYLENTLGFKVWNWEEANSVHYDYPWELDSTLYRKIDIQNIIANLKEIKSPNFLESLVAENAGVLIKQKLLACQSGKGKAIVITVNRVQGTHPNAVDDTQDYSVEKLFELYNYSDARIDYRLISKIHAPRIHVGAEFMLFEKSYYNRYKYLYVKFKRKFMRAIKSTLNIV